MIFFGWPAYPPTKASGRILLLHCSRPPEIVIQSFRKRFEDFDFFDESFSVERGPEDLLGLYSELPRNHNI